jgi:F0F1-type ATP synthase assembly protein I
MKKVTVQGMNAALSVGLEFVGILLVTSFIGWLIDTQLRDTNAGVFFIGGVILGFIYGLYFIVQKMKSFEKVMKIQAKTAEKEDVFTQAKKIEKDIENLGQRIDKFVEREKESRKDGEKG